MPVPVSGGRCRPAAGAGCAAFGLRVSPCSKAVRCSSPIPWDAAFSWRLGMGRARPGRFAPGPARSSTRGAQVRAPVLLAFHPRSLPPTSDPETCEPDLSSVTMSSDLSSLRPFTSACNLDTPSPFSASLPPRVFISSPIRRVSVRCHPDGQVFAHPLIGYPVSCTDRLTIEHDMLHPR